MNKSKLYLAILLIAVIELLWLAQQNRAQTKMRSDNLSLAQTIARETSDRRSPPTAPSSSARNAPDNQWEELNHLRTKVADQQRELQSLQVELAAQPTLPSFQSLPGSNRFVNLPRSSWTPAGDGTPEAALRSMLSAVSSGDLDALRASLTPAELQRRSTGAWKGKTDAEIADAEIQSLSPATGIQILNIQMNSDSQAHFTVFISGLPQTDQPLWFDLSRINGEWKSDRLIGF